MTANSVEVPRLQELQQKICQVREQVASVVVGQAEVVDRILIALLTGGHLLLEGVPGTAKTLLVNSVAHAIDLEFRRVQFTIDLLPSDILGSEVLDQSKGEFHIQKGPIFTNLLLADEINRAAPKVQSALLEAMQERCVTLGRDNLQLPTPFLVIATQNPIEQAGTFELPEAQLDRLLMCHRVTYPSAEEEMEVTRRSLGMGLRHSGEGAVPRTAFDLLSDEPVAHMKDLVDAMAAVQSVHVSEVYLQHVVDLVRRTRTMPALELGASPRAALAFVHAARARAFLYQRDHVLPEDLYALAEDILIHRIRLTYEALADGITPFDIVKTLMDEVA